MRRLGLVAVLVGLAFGCAPAQGSHAVLTAERAAKRAKIVAAAIADRSREPVTWSVSTSSCRPVGTTRHRRDCVARFEGDAGVCRVTIRVRFRSSSSTGTVGVPVGLRC